MTNIQVLYDVSVLGLGEREERARTGVYRVVNRVAEELRRRDDLKVRYSAFGHSCHLSAARRMPESLTGGEDVTGPRFSPTALCLAERFVYRGCHTRFHKIFEPARSPMKRLAARPQISARHLRNVDVFHSPFFPLPSISAEVRGLARVLTAYDLIPIKFPKLFSYGEVDNIRQVFLGLDLRDWVVCISESTRRDLLEFRPDLDPNRIRVTPLAADERFRPCEDEVRMASVRSKIGLPADAPYFLSVCTLEPRKNLRHVLRAFATAARTSDADPYLVLVGSKGWQFEELLEDVRALGRDRVILTGFLPDDDLPPLYSGATAFVYMPLYEGFGLPPLEAMQCGAAVVVSDNSSLPEVVGDAGVLLPCDGEEALVAAMRRLLDDRAERNRLRAAGRMQAAKFSWERCGELTAQTYRDAAAARE